MDLVVTLNGHVLYGEEGARARAVALKHFDSHHVSPEDAARAAWEIEGALEFDIDYEVSGEACRRAQVWADAPAAVAEALGVSPEAVDVELAIDR